MNAHRRDAEARHERAIELAATAIDYGLTGTEMAELDGHLATCASCPRQVSALRADAERLRPPLTLLPSARVDAAVAAAIARRSDRPRLVLLVAAAALLLLGMLGMAAAGAALLRSDDPAPIAVVPSPPASAAPSPTPSPSASTTIGGIDPVVVLRVNMSSDTGAERYPSLTVYRDGTVLSRSGRLTRLTQSGLERLTTETAATGLFAASGDLGFEPGFVGGGAGATIELRRGDGLIRRSTPFAMAEATRAEAERIIALAERLIDHESWLPADAWESGPASATTYVPAHFLVQVTIEEGLEGPPRAVDVADLDWPLPGSLDTFGEAFASPFTSATARCGVIDSAQGLALERALQAHFPDGQPAAGKMSEDLAWAAADRRVTIRRVSPLPGEQLACTADALEWP